jgi:hypothetical protein
MSLGQVDLGAANSNVLFANVWVRSRSLRYRSTAWRRTMGDIEDYWSERGYATLFYVDRTARVMSEAFFVSDTTCSGLWN